MHRLAVHQIPDTLGGKGIDVLEQTAELAIDDPGHLVGDRAGQTGDALIGVDLEKDGDDSGAPRFDRLRHPVAVGGGPRLVLGVDVDRPRQPLLPERLLVLHDAGELPQPQTRDPHVHPLPADLTGYPANNPAKPLFSEGDGSGLVGGCLHAGRTTLVPAPPAAPAGSSSPSALGEELG